MKIFHFCLTSPSGNFGDDILFQATKDTFEQIYNDHQIEWINFPLRYHTSENVIRKANECDIVLVGGGGILLKDTVKNSCSGFQWNITIDHIEKIRKPLIVYSIGYNRFYGQDDFSSTFYDTLDVILNKAVFFSVRNTGSKRALVRSFPKYEDKIAVNPCPSIFYQSSINVPRIENMIGINLAGDRPDMRFNHSQNFFDQLYEACIDITKLGFKISFINHNWNTNSNCKHFQNLINGSTVYDIDAIWSRQDLDNSVAIYKSMTAVIAMRGHAQMIPFGQYTPVVSLISHPKLEWFLEDVNMSDTGVHVSSSNVKDNLIKQVEYCTTTQYMTRMHKSIDKLKDIWHNNNNLIRSKICELNHI